MGLKRFTSEAMEMCVVSTANVTSTPLLQHPHPTPKLSFQAEETLITNPKIKLFFTKVSEFLREPCIAPLGDTDEVAT